MPNLTFLGAAQTVTGSKYLLRAGNEQVLFDCGLFQGLKELRQKNWDPLPLDVKQIDAVVLTHAHIDHVGYLPRLVKDGFRGPVFATPATCDLADVMLNDSARNQEEDAEVFNRKGASKHKPALPLYDESDVARTLPLLRATDREQWFNPVPSIRCRYHDAGHLLGSTMIEVELPGNAGQPLYITFSGDVGRYDAPLYHDPAPPPNCDYLICESTYGNREHPDVNILDQLQQVVTEAVARGGVMVVAAFAVGRSQQLIYLLNVLMQQGRIPTMPVYLDSPMSVAAQNIYAKYAGEQDFAEADIARAVAAPPKNNVHLTRTVGESKQINAVGGPAVIIASSGMMTGGRILHHLRQRLPEPRNTILLGGFMAQGTRGRALQDGARWMRIYGRDVPVRAAVREVSALSGHAGHSELRRWLEPLSPPKRVFITHGELDSATSLAEELKRDRQWNTHVPALGESVEL